MQRIAILLTILVLSFILSFWQKATSETYVSEQIKGGVEWFGQKTERKIQRMLQILTGLGK